MTSSLSVLIASGLPLYAESPLNKIELDFPFLEWLTNSVFVAFLVTAAIVIFARRATKRMQLIPDGKQNFFEAVVEFLYDAVEGIVGKHMVGKVFSLLATIFIFILVANWFSLLPGVGSIGWGEKTGFLSIAHADIPLFRPATADLNMTLGIAALFMVLWFYWTIQELGVKGFIQHTFGVKGGITGVMAVVLFPMFLFVGVIEIISIGFRPVSLSLRLFGNIYAGENLLSTMITLGQDLGLPRLAADVMGVLVPIPFYFMELLVGLLQATVFALLCAVYIQLATGHDEDAH